MVDIHATLILVYGFICKSIKFELLNEKIENSIINNIIGFFDKNDQAVKKLII